eukprot:6489324-Amphidinium_carterae.1
MPRLWQCVLGRQRQEGCPRFPPACEGRSQTVQRSARLVLAQALEVVPLMFHTQSTQEMCEFNHAG